MAQFGITPEGFKLKRLGDILSSQRQRAVSLFQDLVEPGDVVDTTDSSLLGRLITLDSAGDSDLWELAQQTYLSFDPNSATGVALDNLVALSGITRQRATSTTCEVLLKGDLNISIPSDSEVRSSSTNVSFVIPSVVELSPTRASGVDIVVPDPQPTTTYELTYFTSVGVQTVQFTSGLSPSALDVLDGLRGVIASAHPTLSATVSDDVLSVMRSDVFQVVNFEVSNNLSITKVVKPTTVVALEVGPIAAEPSTIDTINTPVLGWDSVTNPVAAIRGRNRETDEELRIRSRNSKFTRASNIVESLYSSLFAVPGVDQVRVYENDTDVTDANGVPGHSFMPIVSGGGADEIGATIWRNKPLGILSFGNTTVTITDSQRFTHDISFERPNPVVVYITLNLTISDSFPSTGEDAIRAALIDYFAENFGIGDDIIYSRLYTPINKIPGHQVDSMFIDKVVAPAATSNLSIAFNEIASLTNVNIVINT